VTDLECLQIDATELYALASPSVPDTVREQALEQARAGKHITNADVQSLIHAPSHDDESIAAPLPGTAPDDPAWDQTEEEEDLEEDHPIIDVIDDLDYLVEDISYDLDRMAEDIRAIQDLDISVLDERVRERITQVAEALPALGERAVRDISRAAGILQAIARAHRSRGGRE
jgi:hypothetical protein